jgi:hypothetical protein
MDFKSYFFGMQPAARDDFAKKCETTVGHLQNVAYGFRDASTELAVLIEQHSKKQVRRVDLFPETFARKWPELAKPARKAKQPASA